MKILADRIMQILQEAHGDYSVQDNRDAATSARTLERIIKQIKEEDASLSTVEELREKFLKP